MKNKVLAIASLICIMGTLPVALSAQKSQRGIVQAAIGTDMASVLSEDVVYMYPEFQKGTIMFNDNTFAEGELNLYLIGSTLHFRDIKGDTLVLKDQDLINMVSIGKDYYMRFDKAYVRILNETDKVAFGIRSILHFEQPQKVGAYGTVNNTAAISEMSSIVNFGDAGGTTYLKSLKNIPYVIRHDGMLYDGTKLYMATRKNFLKLFPGKKNDIIDYCRAHKVDFSNAGHTLALFNYLIQ
ncbi:MAG: hypothetical protein WC396_08000 [Bacteroidales bacterium]|jgi:hypothetical protein|nr:hypothetical protein [Bacteroidales bacterium]